MKRRNASQILKSNTVISKNTKLLLWAGECKNQSNKNKVELTTQCGRGMKNMISENNH